MDGLNSPYAVVVSPDGIKAYVTSTNDRALVVFGRDTATGELTYVECHKDGQGEVTDLLYPAFLGVSPDNYHLYVASMGDKAVSLFRPASQTLTVSHFGSGVGAVTGGPEGIDCGTDCDQEYIQDTPVTFNTDTDGDGISDVVEDAGPNNGDGCDDGVPDSQQGNVEPSRTSMAYT